MYSKAHTLNSLALALIFCIPATAGILYSGPSYFQNFDTLSSVKSSTDLPWTNDSTLAGWFLFVQPAPGTAVTAYRADDGTSNTGRFFSFGPSSGNTTDRALGGLAESSPYFGNPSNGAVAGWIAVALVNNTGQTINQASVQYDGEEWRDQNSNAQTMVLEYGFGNSFTTVASWTAPGAAFNFTSPVHGNTQAVDGNTTGRVANIGGAISSLNWTPGSTLWIRFIENNDTGNDHGLALDNFSFSTTSNVPEPATLATAGLVLLAGAVTRMRRHAK
jgi:hypothetical protein